MVSKAPAAATATDDYESSRRRAPSATTASANVSTALELAQSQGEK